MAIPYYNVAGMPKADPGSTEVPRSGFKLAIDGTDGAIVVFNRHFWSVKHTSKDNAGAASTADVFYRNVNTATATIANVPTLTYAANSAATRESLVIQDGEDEVLQTKKDDNTLSAIFFKAASGTVVLCFRPNEPVSK